MPTVQLDHNGYVIGYAAYLAEGVTLPGSAEVDAMPEDFAEEYHHYRLADGQLVKDAARITEHDRERAKAAGVQAMHARMQQAVLLAAADEEAYTMRYLYPAWEPGRQYAKGDRIMRQDKFYRVEQEHPAQADWQPALYTEIPDPALEWSAWVQPTHAENAYPLGAKVTHNGKRYISQIAGNTAEPGTDPRWWQ